MVPTLSSTSGAPPPYTPASHLDRSLQDRICRSASSHAFLNKLVRAGRNRSRSAGTAGSWSLGRHVGTDIPRRCCSTRCEQRSCIPAFYDYKSSAVSMGGFIYGCGEKTYRLYSCRNSQASPFLHSERSQCLHTRLSPRDLLASLLCYVTNRRPGGELTC